MKSFRRNDAPSKASLFGLAMLFMIPILPPFVLGQDDWDCQKYRWDFNGFKARQLDPPDPLPTQGVPTNVTLGEVNCRYWATTPALVNYYTCTEVSTRYGISNDLLFSLNPGLERDCSNVQPQTDYCVRGFVEPIRALDGLCGPPNNNATCLGTAYQCCNAETWTCGNSTEDCAPGTCYEGACLGDIVYSTDGTCGQAYGSRSCTGKWGNCCSIDGQCGTGEAYCGLFTCQEGDCDIWKHDNQTDNWTPDGYCGGNDGHRCSPEWGRCCNVNGVCGERPADCYLESGCQSEFGICTSNSTNSTDPDPDPPGGPAFVLGLGEFELLGCYREPDGMRALQYVVHNENMTVQMCLTGAAGRTFAGVEYGRECWSGNWLAGNLTEVDDSNCQFLCPGNANQYCGSGNHLVLYSTGPLPVPPSQPATISSSHWVGCMTELSVGRTLDGSTLPDDDMTLEMCASHCAAFQYFGVQYGRECYCGDVINTGSVAAPATDCNMPCGGNNFNLCGGNNRLSIYSKP